MMNAIATEETTGNIDGESPESLVVQAESLFSTYLNARLEQALRAQQHAVLSQKRDPWNALRRSQVREAGQLVARLRAQISEQESRVQSARLSAQAPDSAPAAEPVPSMTAQPTSEFRETQLRRAEQLETGRGNTATAAPSPFLTREEFADLRRNAAATSVRRRV